jgi:hypothetical protein
MSGLKSDFGTVDGFFKMPLQPIPSLSTIGSQLAPIQLPTIAGKGTGSHSMISTIGSQFTIRKPPTSALARLLKAWAF